MKIAKTYLGDSVYAAFDGYGIVLTTENGYPDDPRNVIVMEPQVLRALNEYVAMIERQLATHAEEKA